LLAPETCVGNNVAGTPLCDLDANSWTVAVTVAVAWQ
jgi:hypothetical protein